MTDNAHLRQVEDAIAANPSVAKLHVARGLALRALGRMTEAVGAFRRAVTLEPTLAEAHHELGKALRRAGRLTEALAELRETARLAPGDGAVWLNLGSLWLDTGRRMEAIESFRRALALEPARPEGWNVLAVALLDDGQVRAAAEALESALKLKPDYAAARNNLGRVYRAQGRLAEAVAQYRCALAAGPDPGRHSNLLYALNLADGISPEEVFAEHRAWARAYADPLVSTTDRGFERPRADGPSARGRSQPQDGGKQRGTETPARGHSLPRPADEGQAQPPSNPATRRLRIGFVSPDFCNHAVAYFFEPLLANRDRRDWEAICYSDVAVSDVVTERLRRLSDAWHDVTKLADEQLDALVRRDRIDVLVDLAGHTAHNRLLVFARKPAPLQVTWLGYPNTTGLSAIDYRITDAVSDPVGKTERWHSERLWRMPGPFLAYQPPAESPDVAPAPAAALSRVTFGSFSNFAKVSDRCLSAWAAILNAVPHSRLILKSRGLNDPGLAAEIHGRFEKRGVAADRVQLDGKLVGTREHLDQYRRVDIALDPFPYHGTTTTCEALWMGVPVVTLAGETHVSRVGASLLTHLGATDWIARSTAEYVDQAAALACDVGALSAIRTGLRERMRSSPLCDAVGFAKEWGRVIRAMATQAR